jgi:hypothetical protein
VGAEINEENVEQALHSVGEILGDREYESGVLLYDFGGDSDACDKWLDSMTGQGVSRWRSVYGDNYFGCEAEVVVLVFPYQDIRLEQISRARRQLFILTEDVGDKRDIVESATDQNGRDIFHFC